MVTAEELLVRRLAHLLLKSRGGTYRHNEKDAKAMVTALKVDWVVRDVARVRARVLSEVWGALRDVENIDGMRTVAELMEERG